MPFQIKPSTSSLTIPAFPGVPNVHFGDVLGTSDPALPSPIAGAWFRMDKGPESTPPTYEYDEFGVVIEGSFNFRDETGQSVTVRRGDVFFFPRGSTITFSSEDFGVAVKVRGQALARL
ncbi:hypothetical protein BJY04DRAFT_223796 [Aspergillus karnatakaensis]|uniref:uncharacterized protein n=1 Tax=Aspergillus karnatakaensis TaxID=1810916 RepID=UPI003CCD96BF